MHLPSWEKRGMNMWQMWPAHIPPSARISVVCCGQLPTTITCLSLPEGFPGPLEPALLPTWQAVKAGEWMTPGTALVAHRNSCTYEYIPSPLPIWVHFTQTSRKPPAGLSFSCALWYLVSNSPFISCLSSHSCLPSLFPDRFLPLPYPNVDIIC